MARGNPPVEVRVDETMRARWQAEARDRGYSLSEFVRECVEAQMSDTPEPSEKKRKKATASNARVTKTANPRGDLGAREVTTYFKGGK